MKGKWFVKPFLALAVIFGAALYYFQVYAHYEWLEKADTILVQEQEIAVSDFNGIDAATSPNKLRACFRVDPATFKDVARAPDPEPLLAPGWFDCFNAETITQDLEAGRATAYLAGDETPDGAVGYEVLRFIAVYPDGNAFLWRHYRSTE